jgi:hypothetical protein
MLYQRISVGFPNAKVTYSKHYSELTKIAVVVSITFLLLLGMQQAAFALLAAVEQGKQEWKSFRSTYPFHLQVIGLSSPLSDQSRVLLISEPPDRIKPDYFQRLADSVGGEALVGTKSIGYDGWAKDVVLALPPLDEKQLSTLLAQLHRELYGTSYKANVVRLPVKAPSAKRRSLDLSVSVADLNNWLNKGNLKFTPILGGTSHPLATILSARQSGVFVSTQPGLVIWSIPRDRDLANYRAEARQFFLDSDLIVGAIANNHQLVIVARERVEPLLRLPPLRVETALMLAAERSDELAQSYERNHLFAGKLRSDEDWAPIYLSDSLINTEFGSLLNITDQLLKSWSLNGSINYKNFDYPKPSQWAPFPRPMSEIPGSVLFNWNTAGAGYTTSIEPYDFFALNRTGALPITYGFKSNSVQTYERIAYKYFAELGNPDFARVVQYTAIYQIFRKFGITTKESAIQETLLPGTIFLAEEAVALLKNLQARSRDEGLVEKLRETAKQSELQSQKASDWTKLIRLLEAINEGTTRWPNDAIPQLALLIASPRTYIPTIRGERNFTDWALSTYKQIKDPDITRFLVVLFNIEEVKEGYVKALSKDPNTWIKTPSIVLSQDVVSAYTVGGHNLDSTLTRLQSSPNVPIGTVRIVKDGTASVILYNPNDVGKVHSLSRVLATEAENQNLVNNLERALKSSEGGQRRLAQALNLPTEPSISTQQGGRGLTKSLEPSPSSPPLGWHPRNKPLTPEELQRLKVADTFGTYSIIIERSPDGYTIFQSGNKQVVEAHTLPSFHEALAQSIRSISADDQPIQLYLNGFTPQEAKALTLTAELRDLKTQKAFLRSNRSFDESIALLQHRYDWSKATIRDSKVKFLPDNPNFKYQQTIEVEVASTIPNKPSLRIRFITLLKELPAQLIEKITTIIQQVLARPTSQKRNINQVVLEINRELKKEFPDITVEVQYNEAGDIIITDSVERNRYKRRNKL